jgi:hypothetical protein
MTKPRPWLPLKCLISVGVVLLSLSASALSAGCGLRTADSTTLAGEGVSIGCPSTQSQQVSEKNARQAALAAFPQSQVREVAFRHVSDSHINPAIDRDMWVVSIMPAGGFRAMQQGPPGASASNGGYFLVFIDAKTGHFVSATQAGQFSSRPTSTTNSGPTTFLILLGVIGLVALAAWRLNAILKSDLPRRRSRFSPSPKAH